MISPQVLPSTELTFALLCLNKIHSQSQHGYPNDAIPRAPCWRAIYSIPSAKLDVVNVKCHSRIGGLSISNKEHEPAA